MDFIITGTGFSFHLTGNKSIRGMVVGVNSRQEDIVVNVCKKHVTNMRASGSDEALKHLLLL